MNGPRGGKIYQRKSLGKSGPEPSLLAADLSALRSFAKHIRNIGLIYVLLLSFFEPCRDG